MNKFSPVDGVFAEFAGGGSNGGFVPTPTKRPSRKREQELREMTTKTEGDVAEARAARNATDRANAKRAATKAASAKATGLNGARARARMATRAANKAKRAK